MFPGTPRTGMVYYIDRNTRDGPRAEAAEKILAQSERKFL